MKSSKMILLVSTVSLGVIAPFIDVFVILQGFFLPVVYLIVVIVSLVCVMIAFIEKKSDKRSVLLALSLLPLFILSQFLSSYAVDLIQKNRGEVLIAKLEKSKAEKGKFPEEMKTGMGIDYKSLPGKDDFIVSYSRGFLVTKKYQYSCKSWASYDWND